MYQIRNFKQQSIDFILKDYSRSSESAIIAKEITQNGYMVAFNKFKTNIKIVTPNFKFLEALRDGIMVFHAKVKII